jgi:glycosyltransferase involved in cell wall biosynthesis
VGQLSAEKGLAILAQAMALPGAEPRGRAGGASIAYETFGLVVIEAFDCGTPAIVSRIGALAELVRDGETGLLFEPGNPRDLADKLAWAHSHPERMAACG